jgi:hypothetical protein
LQPPIRWLRVHCHQNRDSWCRFGRQHCVQLALAAVEQLIDAASRQLCIVAVRSLAGGERLVFQVNTKLRFMPEVALAAVPYEECKRSCIHIAGLKQDR